VQARGLGRAVPAGDAGAFARACAELLADSSAERANALRVAEEMRWDRVVEPLLQFCLDGAKRPPTGERRRAVTAATLRQYVPIAAETLGTDGLTTLTRKLAANASRALRRR
jgi:hypothetical protein